MSCQAVKNGEVKVKGKPSIEFYIDGKPQYYCYGYCYDGSSNDVLESCKNCKKHVDNAQDDLDNIRKLR